LLKRENILMEPARDAGTRKRYGRVRIKDKKCEEDAGGWPDVV